MRINIFIHRKTRFDNKTRYSLRNIYSVLLLTIFFLKFECVKRLSDIQVQLRLHEYPFFKRLLSGLKGTDFLLAMFSPN